MKFISSTNDIRKYLGLKPKKNIKFKNISIDTRTIKKDSLFIALKGENFNGNKFIEKAFSSGAIAVLCSDKSYIKKNNVIYVPSVRKALSKISSEIASDFKGKKILITGSNGKTSTTNIISKSLPKCSSTIKNFNNEIGLPISIMSSKKDSKYMVLEAGAAKKGDIEYLSKIVKPDIGIITNIGNSHLEKLINIEGVFKVKSELIKNIRKGGTLIVPNDMNYLQRWKNMAKGINVIPVPKKFIAKNEKISKDKKVMTFDIINSCNDDKKDKILEILNAHPELAVAKKMTSESVSEQASAKLNQCSNDEYEEFKKLNIEYKKKFNFPFIIAVKGKNKNEILNNFRQRIQSDIESEFLEAKKQVKKIATFRLNEINKK